MDYCIFDPSVHTPDPSLQQLLNEQRPNRALVPKSEGEAEAEGPGLSQRMVFHIYMSQI